MVDTVELVKMSGKGQLVVPQDVRKIAKLLPGERFVAFPVQEGVLFKKIRLPTVKANFDVLTKEVSQQFKKTNVKKREVAEAITWVRKK